MRFHVLLPGSVHAPAITQPWELSLTGDDIVRVAQVADECGFESLRVPEHFVMGIDHTETTGQHHLDATTAQAVMAGATKRIKLGSMLTILPLHDPIVLAKSLTTLDWLSGGRAAIAVGLGWQHAEYRALGVPWKERGERADEYLAAMLELWRSDTPSFNGKYVSFSDISFEPKPVQKPNPQLWIGGDADASLRRAARFGDGWAPWLTAPEEIPSKLERIRSFPDFDGRPFAVFYSLMATRIGLSDGRHVARDGHPSDATPKAGQVIDECGQLAEWGVTDTWVPPPPVRGIDEYIDNLRWIAEAVVPAFAQTPAQ